MLTAVSRVETWQMKEPFEISREVIASLRVLHVELHDSLGSRGVAEAAGVDYDGETPEAMARQIGITRIAAVANRVRNAADRQFLEQVLPDLDIIGWIPFSERLCSLDRDGISVLDGLADHETGVFSSLADRILPEKSS